MLLCMSYLLFYVRLIRFIKDVISPSVIPLAGQVQLVLSRADAQATQVSRDETSGVMAGLPASVIVPLVSHVRVVAPLAQ